MDLSNSTEPARNVSLSVASVIAAVGAAFVAANAAWAQAPDWFSILSVAVTAAVSALGVHVGGQVIRSNVSPVVTLPSITARSNLTADGAVLPAQPDPASFTPVYDASGAPLPPGHPDAVPPGTPVQVHAEDGGAVKTTPKPKAAVKSKSKSKAAAKSKK